MTVLAYRRDGAIMERNSRQEWKNYIFLDTDWDIAQIKFPRERRSIRIDHAAKQFSETARVPGGSPVWDPDDNDCAKMAVRFKLSDVKRIANGVIAGIPSIEYSGMRSKTERHSVWLAPSLGCTQMKHVASDYNGFGLATWQYWFEVVLARTGEPDANLFEVPPGYQRTDSP